MILKKPAQGLFLSFEGGEGSGKSTQARMLAAFCQRVGLPHILTREPGGSPAAEIVRSVIVRGDTDFHPLSELLLVNAARLEHVRKTIMPALAAGQIVICDRFVDSSIAYQGAGRGLGADLVRDWHHRLMPGFYPDHTILLWLEPATGLARSGGTARNEDRFEKAGLDFHQRIADGFGALAAAEPARFTVLDAARDIDTLHTDCVAVLERLYRGRGA